MMLFDADRERKPLTEQAAGKVSLDTLQNNAIANSTA